MRWVADGAGLEALLEDAGRDSIIAVDTEADSLHSYFEKVCLIQLTTGREDWIVDPLAVDPRPLARIFSDRSITKVFHGADYDLRILNRDFDLEIVNLIDTMICAQFAGETAIGLAALLQKFFSLELDKSHQRADWSRRPLPAAMLDYASTDTRHLIRLAQLLRAELERLGRWEWAEEEFSRLEEIRHTPPDEDQPRYRKLKGAKKLDRRGLEVLSRLHSWRDGIARKRDVPPFKVIGNDALVDVARQRPADARGLETVPALPGALARRHGRQLLAIVAEAMAVPEAELPEKVVGKPWVRDRDLDRKVDRLKKARDRIAGELNLEPSVLAPRHLLTAVAQSDARSVDELEIIEAMRGWQRRVLGPALVSELVS